MLKRKIDFDMKTPARIVVIPTLQESFEQYLADRRDLRPATVYVYKEVIKRAGSLLNLPINQIKYSDIKHLYSCLRYDQQYKPASIELLNSVLMPIFNLALRDGLIKTNPVKGVYREVARGPEWKSHRKNAISIQEQEEFLNFIHNSEEYKHWENFFVFLFGTGVRIGEAVALRWEDIDFENKMIEIRRSAYYVNGSFVEGPPKTEAGIRSIPMFDKVAKALKKEKQIALLVRPTSEKNIPGKTGLVFVSSKGTMLYTSTVNNTIVNIIKAHNNMYPEKEIQKFSVHQIRHSFCSRLVDQDVNIKVIQSIMGHSDFQTTMDVYAHVSEKKKKEAFKALEGKLIL